MPVNNQTVAAVAQILHAVEFPPNGPTYVRFDTLPADTRAAYTARAQEICDAYPLKELQETHNVLFDWLAGMKDDPAVPADTRTELQQLYNYLSKVKR